MKTFLVIVCLIFAGQIFNCLGKEPTHVFQGLRVPETYARFTKIPEDIHSTRYPMYLATFNGSFLAEDSGSRVFMFNKDVGFVPLIYIIEFGGEIVDKLPEVVQQEVARLFSGINLSTGLYNGLKAKGVRNFFIAACGFGHLPPQQTLLPKTFLFSLDRFRQFQRLQVREEKKQEEDLKILLL